MANTGFLRLAGLLCVIGGILQLVLGIAESFFPVQALSPEFVFRQVLVEISYVPVLIGVIGLALSGVAGNGWLAKIGLGGALLGSFLFILAGMIMLLIQPALGEATIWNRHAVDGIGHAACRPRRAADPKLVGMAPVHAADLWTVRLRRVVPGRRYCSGAEFPGARRLGRVLAAIRRRAAVRGGCAVCRAASGLTSH